MRNEIKYEWTLETKDVSGDIVDSDFSDVLDFDVLPVNADLGLVRNVGNEVEGLTDRSWAYVVKGLLPDYFTDASGKEIAQVPRKYKIELAAYIITKMVAE